MSPDNLEVMNGDCWKSMTGGLLKQGGMGILQRPCVCCALSANGTYYSAMEGTVLFPPRLRYY